MNRICAADEAALEALYDRYAPAVMGLALRILGDRALAEEVVQETFWRADRAAARAHLLSRQAGGCPRG